ncbi:YlaI family protein [Oceanobacillus senegalensis]|uniref:YlaI family protein n=1 Tax=Oceanobacillus senegalensis TaxID=1936063 RepID=UPI000A30C3E4|nr:YlaI family protein [Oceanobacillus senegalensis]
MQVKCTLCDRIDSLMDNSFQAKKLRNRRRYMYLCDNCYERIDNKTKQRHATGKFRLYKEKKREDDFI